MASGGFKNFRAPKPLLGLKVLLKWSFFVSISCLQLPGRERQSERERERERETAPGHPAARGSAQGHQREGSQLLPESWTRIDVKIRSGDSTPMRHPQWFIGRMVKTTFALEKVPGTSPTYEWVLMEKRAPITDVNTWEVEARPLLTVIFIQQAYDIVFYEAEPVPKKTWEEQLSPPLPTVLGGVGAGAKGKGKGKDAKGQGKGPLYRGGPAPDQDAQNYVDRWGRTRQYRDYKGGSMQGEEPLPTASPNKSLARPAGTPYCSPCLCVSLLLSLHLSSHMLSQLCLQSVF